MPDQEAIAKDLVSKLSCEDDFLFFCQYMFKKTKNQVFSIAKHHKIIADTLERVSMGEIKRLIINIPPRYSKTEMAVINWMAWSLARNHSAKFIHISYSKELALENSARARELVQHEEFQKLWPIELKDDSKAKHKWWTAEDGGVYAAAAGGSITGFGAGNTDGSVGSGAIIIDDPLKPDDAKSEVVRAAINERFYETIENRINHENIPIILIMQRLHEDDMSGHLLKTGDWTHLNIPVFDANEEPLWPEKHSKEGVYL